jgi:hypothetical protein
MKALRLITLLTVVGFSLNSLAADATTPPAPVVDPAAAAATAAATARMQQFELYQMMQGNKADKTCDDLWSKYSDDTTASNKDVRDQQNQYSDKQKQAQQDQKSAWDDVTQDQKEIAQAGTDFHKDQADAQKQSLQDAQQALQDQSKIQTDLTSTQNGLPVAQLAVAQAQEALNTGQLTFNANYVRLQCISELQSKYPKATSARGSNSSIGGEIQWINQTWDQCVKTQEATVQLTIEKLEAQVTSAQVQLTQANAQIQQDKTALQQAQTSAQQQKAQTTTAQNQAQQDYNSKVQSMQSKMQLDQQNAQQVATQSQQALAREQQEASTSAYAQNLSGDIAALSVPHKTGNTCTVNGELQPQMMRCCREGGNPVDADGNVAGIGSTPSTSAGSCEAPDESAISACPQASLTSTQSSDPIASAISSLTNGLDSLSSAQGRTSLNPGGFNLSNPVGAAQ